MAPIKKQRLQTRVIKLSHSPMKERGIGGDGESAQLQTRITKLKNCPIKKGLQTGPAGQEAGLPCH